MFLCMDDGQCGVLSISITRNIWHFICWEHRKVFFLSYFENAVNYCKLQSHYHAIECQYLLLLCNSLSINHPVLSLSSREGFSYGDLRRENGGQKVRRSEFQESWSGCLCILLPQCLSGPLGDLERMPTLTTPARGRKVLSSSPVALERTLLYFLPFSLFLVEIKAGISYYEARRNCFSSSLPKQKAHCRSKF